MFSCAKHMSCGTIYIFSDAKDIVFSAQGLLKARQDVRRITIYISRDPCNLNSGVIFLKPAATYMFYCAQDILCGTTLIIIVLRHKI
jgi:hypothetical protein